MVPPQCCLQVLELAVSPVLDHVASAQVLQECSVFDVTRLGQMQLGITGMSLDKTYRCVQPTYVQAVVRLG